MKERKNKRFEKSEISIQKHELLKPENQFIKRMIKIHTRALGWIDFELFSQIGLEPLAKVVYGCK